MPPKSTGVESTAPTMNRSLVARCSRSRASRSASPPPAGAVVGSASS